MSADVRARFLAKVEKTDGCWLWTAAKYHDGYGAFCPRKRLVKRAHRVSWEMFRGPIPAGLMVCHHCDVHACVNPDHLFLGTHAANMADRDAKGRRVQVAKLTGDDVLDIRAAHAFGGLQADIATAYNVDQSAISLIVNRRTWRHLP